MSFKDVRFTCRVNGLHRKLMKVSENASGDLTVSPTIAEYADGRYAIVKSKGSYFSVHVSPRSDGYTIKHTNRYESGEISTSSVFFPGAKESFIAFLSARVCPRMDLEHYLYTPKPRERHLDMGEYDPAEQTLTYVTLVADNNAKLSQNIPSSCYYRAHRFRLFTICLFPAIVRCASPGSGTSLFLNHGPKRWNQEDPPRQKIMQSIPAIGIYSRLAGYNFGLRPEIIRLTAMTYGHGPQVQAAREAMRYFGHAPIF